MELLALPREIISLIAQSLPSAAEMAVLLRVNRCLNKILRDDIHIRDIKDTGGLNLTFYAFWGYDQQIRDMLRLGADINIRNTRWRDYTPLEVAISRAELPPRALVLAIKTECEDPTCREDLTLMNMLIDAGADPNEPFEGRLPVSVALSSSSRDPVKVELLIARGADVTAFGTLARIMQHLEADKLPTAARKILFFEVLLGAGCDVNATVPSPALNIAAESVPELVPLFLEHGADVHARSVRENRTALHYAVMGNSDAHIDATRLLIEHGADVNARDAYECTPLHYVRGDRPKYRQLADMLCAEDADKDARDKDGHTILHKNFKCSSWSTYKKTASEVECLVDATRWMAEHGIDFNVRDETGETAIFSLIHPRFAGHTHVSTILELGADVNSRSPHGRTPLMQAARYGLNQVVRLLLENGADVHHADNDGLQALHWVSRLKARSQNPTEMLDCIHALLDYGADVNAPTLNGSTPLSLALTAFCPSRDQALRDAGAIEPLESIQSINSH
ncbi:hypothetical protein N7468_002022 [Penicillium chermesinum]|uniref:Uncharacterized protein n=1 Tax=Penicillium chermesinum TaxID=63820 RepID=A0A9W9PHP6_9EURO|nr:uncharacterized protein N7468_002022 [Penicillium chermesinum]KAJ5247039.1 hypothetical protein N7468_002022 [Penicillium chermesinum]